MIPWLEPPRGVPHAFTHGLCPGCASDVHPHGPTECCSIDGCSCDEGEDS